MQSSALAKQGSKGSYGRLAVHKVAYSFVSAFVAMVVHEIHVAESLLKYNSAKCGYLRNHFSAGSCIRFQKRRELDLRCFECSRKPLDFRLFGLERTLLCLCHEQRLHDRHDFRMWAGSTPAY